MDRFFEQAEQVITYQIRKSWFEISRLYNEIATRQGISVAMGFTLLTIHPEKGSPVTKIAPRMGMEPNSLSRLLKSMETRDLIYRRKDQNDKRKVFVCLTEKGRRHRKKAYESVFGLDNQIVQDIAPEKLAAFFEVMQQVQQTVARMETQL